MRTAGGAAKWWVIAIVAILAALVWTSLREPAPPMPSPSASAPAAGAAPDNPLEAPPPLETTPSQATTAARYPEFLPPEAIDTLRLIARGGPYPYRQDDGVFGNRERLLPPQPRGYYREYTVETPGSRDRGARRIVTGGRPPIEYYYTDDHYRSFRRFTLDGAENAR